MKKIIYISLLFLPSALWAQSDVEPKTSEGKFTFDIDQPFKLLENDEDPEDPIKKKKKKRKRKVFYGLKTKKGIIQKGIRPTEVIEKFYYLKKASPPNRFVRDIYWYDVARGAIRKSKKFDPEKGFLLHGTYLKIKRGAVVEEGIFYKGTKHGRWMKYSTHDVLEEKEKYYKGWPKESLMTYYDPKERTKIKEIIPIHHGEREGYYYQFHENGKIAVFGEYQWDHKVNNWIENYPTGNRKKIIAYPKNPFEHLLKPFIKTEWDLRGKKIYSSRRRQ